MSISDMNKRHSGKAGGKGMRKTVIVYLALSATAIAIDNIYALFGHGVRSASMSFMFLYPLLGGSLLYFLFGAIRPGMVSVKPYRLGYNLYNSGIATLTTGSFFKGILDIAGTASEYTKIFMLIGLAFAITGLVILIATAIRADKKSFPQAARGL